MIADHIGKIYHIAVFIKEMGNIEMMVLTVASGKNNLYYLAYK